MAHSKIKIHLLHSLKSSFKVGAKVIRKWSCNKLVLRRQSVFCNELHLQSNLPKPDWVKWTISASDNDNDIILLLLVNKQVCWIKTPASILLCSDNRKAMYQLKLKRFSSISAACIIISNTRKTKSLYNADLHMISVIQRQDYYK